MEYFLFVKEYYYYFILFISLLIIILFYSYIQNKLLLTPINIIVFFFCCFSVYYIGGRNMEIGFDTFRYEQSFILYKESSSFFVRKDVLFDFITYFFSKYSDFKTFLTFCAFIYIFGSLYGIRMIFSKYYFLPFLVFIIYPYFINSGINVIRSGMATALFLMSLGYYYRKAKLWKILLCIIGSLLIHISMLFPLMFFLATLYLNKTKLIFFIWLGSILVGVLKINLLINFISLIEMFTQRANDYIVAQSENNSWDNFVIYGFFPVVFGIYNILFLDYKNEFYKRLINTYMLIHIPYIILISTERASRIGYLAEFMMPVLLMFPFLIQSKIKSKYLIFKICIAIFIVFLIKAYKILII